MIEQYKPELKDLWFRKKMLEDEETMTYNKAWGGTIPFPEEDWKEWYDHWIGMTIGLQMQETGAFTDTFGPTISS